jgi:hypothetical protein
MHETKFYFHLAPPKYTLVRFLVETFPGIATIARNLWQNTSNANLCNFFAESDAATGVAGRQLARVYMATMAARQGQRSYMRNGGGGDGSIGTMMKR